MLMILMMTLAVPIRGGVPPSRASTTILYLGRREEKKGTEEWSDGASEKAKTERGKQREAERERQTERGRERREMVVHVRTYNYAEI